MENGIGTGTLLQPLEFHLFRQLEQLNASHQEEPSRRRIFLLCVSGGMDSMTLLHLFQKVRIHRTAHALGQMEIHILHCNHERRGDASTADAQLVVSRCAELGLPCHVERWSESGPPEDASGNFQNLARIWRYERANAILNKIDASEAQPSIGWIVTAHHARDHAETLLLHLIRGCGAPGLLGVRALDVAERRFRPLCRVSYEDLKNYAREQLVSYREDDSNMSETYDRNFVRHRILPLLAEKNPSYQKALLRLSDNIEEIITLADEASSLRPLSPLSPLTATRILLHARRLSPELGEILSADSLENILHHCQLVRNSHSGRRGKTYCVPLGNNWEVLVSEQEVVFRHKVAH